MNLHVMKVEEWQLLNQKIDAITSTLEAQKEAKESDRWLTSEQVLKRLKISSKTLQNYRDKKVIPYSQFGSKIYYKAAHIEAHLLNHLIK